MIKIKKSKSGFRVQYLGRNSEILAVSEVLSSKANAWKNVKAMMKLFRQDKGVVEDDKGQIWYILDGEKIKPNK